MMTEPAEVTRPSKAAPTAKAGPSLVPRELRLAIASQDRDLQQSDDVTVGPESPRASRTPLGRLLRQVEGSMQAERHGRDKELTTSLDHERLAELDARDVEQLGVDAVVREHRRDHRVTQELDESGEGIVRRDASTWRTGASIPVKQRNGMTRMERCTYGGPVKVTRIDEAAS